MAAQRLANLSKVLTALVVVQQHLMCVLQLVEMVTREALSSVMMVTQLQEMVAVLLAPWSLAGAHT